MNDLVPMPFDTPEFLAIWKDWLDYRRERKLRSYTPTGLKRTVNMLRKLGVDRAIAAIDNSMAQHYQGIFEPSANARMQSNGDHKGIEQWLKEESNDDAR